MSYFHEYTNKHRKTLRTYSRPVGLDRFPIGEWITNEEDCWDVGAALDDVRHYRLITPAQARRLMPRDATELPPMTWCNTKAATASAPAVTERAHR